MTTQDWEHGREEAIARAIADAVKEQYRHSGRFYDVVLDFIDEHWQPKIKPFPSNEEIGGIVDEMLAAWRERQPDTATDYDDDVLPITVDALVRAMANGCPLDTAPDHIWRGYCEAMRELAQQVLRQQQRGATTQAE